MECLQSSNDARCNGRFLKLHDCARPIDGYKKRPGFELDCAHVGSEGRSVYLHGSCFLPEGNADQDSSRDESELQRASGFERGKDRFQADATKKDAPQAGMLHSFQKERECCAQRWNVFAPGQNASRESEIENLKLSIGFHVYLLTARGNGTARRADARPVLLRAE
jgi:hypothetical protein